MHPVRMGRSCRAILTNEARSYIGAISIQLQSLMRMEKITPIDTFSYVDLWFILPRSNCDAHNYGKILFDAMEQGGLVTNDKYILPRIMGVSFGKPSKAIVKIPFGRATIQP
jgi:Holliday junction resolvase RusA-like endonuclease